MFVKVISHATDKIPRCESIHECESFHLVGGTTKKVGPVQPPDRQIILGSSGHPENRLLLGKDVRNDVYIMNDDGKTVDFYVWEAVEE